MKRVVLLLGLLGLWAQATGFGVAPSRTVLHPRPETRAGAVLTVFSPDGTAVRPLLVDWRINPDGDVELLPAGSLPRSLAPYLRVGNGVLEPRPRAALPLEVQLPAGAEGSYHAALLLVPATAPPAAGRAMVLEAQAAILHPILAVVPGTERPELSLDGAQIKDGQLEALLVNRGNVYLRVRAVLAALDARGSILSEAVLMDDLLFPGATRRLRGRLPAGTAVARLAVNAPGVAPIAWEGQP